MTKPKRAPWVIELLLDPSQPPSWLVELPRGAHLLRADARAQKSSIVTSMPTTTLAIRLVYDVDPDARMVLRNVVLLSPGQAADGARAVGCAISPVNGVPVPIYEVPATKEQIAEWEAKRAERDAEDHAHAEKAISSLVPQRAPVDVPTTSVASLGDAEETPA